MTSIRPNSVAFCGGAYGDEGKGKIVDTYVHEYAKNGKVIVYRDNGGANAGHTVELDDGRRVALHQLPSGVFHDNATIVLGKGMVIHPTDLLAEIRQVRTTLGDQKGATILIDSMATLSLDTHRAFEAVLKEFEEGGKGSTGRGIAPAYMDILLRHPVRARDLVSFDEEKLARHYNLYEGLMKGLGKEIASIAVPRLEGSALEIVGTKEVFIARLREDAVALTSYIKDVYELLDQEWKDHSTAFVFEKAQAVGLDIRYGVYPDVTASDTTFDGIYASTEGIISADAIEKKAAVLKATYMSTVGTRVLPTMMEETLASRIRGDANEYGATTKRPRGIAYLDIPSIAFFLASTKANALILTHMDITYTDVPVKVCVGYVRDGKSVPYRPDQQYLSTVTPVYEELASWDQAMVQSAASVAQLPQEARSFLSFMVDKLNVPIIGITTGPRRSQQLTMSS